MARLVQRLGLTRFDADEAYKKGLDAYKKGDFDEAITLINEAIELLPSNAEYFASRGLVFLEDGILDKARKDFEQALKLYDFEMLAHYGLGVIEYNEKNWNAALKHFMDAYQADPSRVETVFYIGLVYYQIKDYVTALKVLHQVREQFEARGDKRRTLANKWIQEIEKLI